MMTVRRFHVSLRGGISNQAAHYALTVYGTQQKRGGALKSDFASVLMCQIVKFFASGSLAESELPTFLLAVDLSVF